jgi:hypothetical protein
VEDEAEVFDMVMLLQVGAGSRPPGTIDVPPKKPHERTPPCTFCGFPNHQLDSCRMKNRRCTSCTHFGHPSYWCPTQPTPSAPQVSVRRRNFRGGGNGNGNSSSFNGSSQRYLNYGSQRPNRDNSTGRANEHHSRQSSNQDHQPQELATSVMEVTTLSGQEEDHITTLKRNQHVITKYTKNSTTRRTGCVQIR